MSVILRVIGGPGQGQEHVFDRHGTVVVGRQGAHLSFPDDTYLSRSHFLLEFDPPRCLLRDLGSLNGTLVNGEPVRGEAILHDGDTIKAGASEFAVQVDTTLPHGVEVHCLRCLTAVAPPEVLAAARPDEGRLDWVCPACQEKARAFPTPPPGFWIERKLGGGGMGEVYLARREADRRPIAVKMLIPSGAAGERAKQYFRRELEILRNLRHPNIVRFGRMIEQDGQFQLIMEYVPGLNAREWVDQVAPRPLSVETAAWIGVQLLAGLAHAHAKGYVHRDIKPSNLLVSGPPPYPTVKLSDFGLAKSFRDNAGFTGLTHQGDIGGSIGFISPDHIREFGELKEPADLYSTGTTLYYLLTGNYPFLGFKPNEPAAITMILEHPVVPLRAHRPDIPEAFERVIKKSLEKRPKDRWRSAEQMADALRPFVGPGPGLGTGMEPAP
jgi:serine/threonine-protein kinase